MCHISYTIKILELINHSFTSIELKILHGVFPKPSKFWRDCFFLEGSYESAIPHLGFQRDWLPYNRCVIYVFVGTGSLKPVKLIVKLEMERLYFAVHLLGILLSGFPLLAPLALLAFGFCNFLGS